VLWTLGGVGLFLAITASARLLPRPVLAAPTEQSGTNAQPPTISVAGEGEVRAEPDMAVVSVGVTSVAATAQGAMTDVNRRLVAVVAGAKALGVQDRDVQTSGLSLQPIYRPRGRGDDLPPEIDGYRASNNVSLTVRDLAGASSVLDSATRDGANVIGGLRFGISNVEELRIQALAQATVNADAKARSIAGAAGVPIKGIASITEESVSVPRPQAEAFMALRAAPAADQAPPPVEAGEMIVRARIRASYNI
jgi:uncharacterized protein YggE